MRLGWMAASVGWLVLYAGWIAMPAGYAEIEAPTVQSGTTLRHEPLSAEDELYNKAYKRLWEETDFWQALIASPSQKFESQPSHTSRSPIQVFGDTEKDLIWFSWSTQVLGHVRRIEIFDIIGERLATLHPGTRESIAWNFGDRSAEIISYQVWFINNHHEQTLPPHKIAIFR